MCPISQITIYCRVVLLIFTSFLVLLCFKVEAQYDINNASKYYKYRDRFTNNFIVVGPSPGQSVPFSMRNSKAGSHFMEGGEQTFQLGNYIAFLASEYDLFKRSGLQTDKTVRELFFALDAVNRLDLTAEDNDINHTGTPKLNGFFVREDVPSGFLENYKSALNTNTKSLKKHYKYLKGSGENLEVNRNREEEVNGGVGLKHRFMSHDHAVRVLWGLYLAHELVSPDLNYENRSFRDGEKNFKNEIFNIYERIILFFEDNDWRIKRPNGENVSRGALVYIFKRELSRSMVELKKRHYAEKGFESVEYKRMSFSYGVFRRGVLGLKNKNAWLNGRMQLETQNLSGNSFRVWQRAYDFGYEPYFIYYGMLVHGWKLPMDKKEDLKKISEFYLNIAPCNGNFNHGKGDLSSFGWATPDRTERSLTDTYIGTFAQGNFSGLDFLLLHNLYYLNNLNSLPAFPKNYSKSDCIINCKWIEEGVKQKELKRVKQSIGRKKTIENAKLFHSLDQFCKD